MISELLARLGPAPVQQLPPASRPARSPTRRRGTPRGQRARRRVGVGRTVRRGDDRCSRVRPGSLPARYPCRYAGAMLLHAYLDRVGAEAIFATVTGGPARRYDDLAVLSTATLGFAWGIDTVEGSKHLRRAEAGAVARARPRSPS